ncbi:Transposase [Jannaschia seosinensis]|uniref:Transposase n=1 Tax=Jannaschia seosinensis TaxID=313367 RepID=A0A0M7BC79_9RHOB|nr:IS1595 family transposase [Jannaschia seosinensis]CUH40407.1 Transposase [Jannaschia seosinensis]
MSHFDPAEFSRMLARLTPQELRQVEGIVAEARKRAEAVLEIDARAEAGGPASSCPRCGGDERIRWGRTRTGAQRWNCSGCGATWSGRSDTPLARVHRPDLVVALARDMIEAPQPMSCRRGAEVLDTSRHSIWRWRMTIIGALAPEPDGTLAGIVEADEAREPKGVAGVGPAPARSGQRPRAAALALARLPATDRGGHRVFEAITDAGQRAISGALLPVMARDAVLCTDGLATYARIARDERIPHFALNAGRRSKRTPRSHHINTVNALIGRFRTFMKPFCSPSAKNLAAYGRWHAARDNDQRDYLDVLRLLLASGPRANTVC